MKQRLFTFFKWALCLIVLVFVVQHGLKLWNQGNLETLEIQYGWLLLAGLVYLVAWLPSVWFWRQLMMSCGAKVSWKAAIRAYYCGHLGKYVPGKAVVLVIRTALVKEQGCRPAIAALTATCETLMMMGTGLVVTCCLLPFIFSTTHLQKLPHWIHEFLELGWLLPTIVVGITIGLLPVISRLLTWVGRKMTPANYFAENRIKIRSSLLLKGLLGFGLSWMGLGASLGLVVLSLQPEISLMNHFWTFTAATSLATSLGFLALFAPGGIGVREGLLMWALAAIPEINPTHAVAAAILLRLLWLFFEIGAAGALYYSKKWGSS